MRIDSPGVRRVIAHRALLGAMRGWARLPKDMILPDVVRMEEAFLRNDAGVPLTDEQVVSELRRIRRIVRC